MEIEVQNKTNNNINNQNNYIDEDDDVICEFDLVLNNNFLNNLKILQYPLRPNTFDYSLNSELQRITFSSNSYNFEYKNKQKAQDKKPQQSSQFSITMQNKSTNNNSISNTNNNNVNSFSIKGEIISPKTNYCIGVLKDKTMYLNPVTEIIQLRPYPSVSSSNQKEKDKEKEVNYLLSNYTKQKQNTGNSHIKQNTHTNSLLYKDYTAIDENAKTIIPYPESSIESQIQQEKLYSCEISNNTNNSITSKPLSQQAYNDFVFSNISQITVAEKLYQEATNQVALKDLDSMTIKDKLVYMFSRSPVLSINNIVKLCKYNSSMAENKISFEDYVKSLCQWIVYYCYLCNNNSSRDDGSSETSNSTNVLLVTKSDLVVEDVIQKTKRNYVISNLKNGVTKASLLSFPTINNEITALLKDLGEYYQGKWYLKGFKETVSEFKNNSNIKSKNGHSNIDYINMSSNELETITRNKIIELLRNKMKEDKEFLNYYENYSYIRKIVPEVVKLEELNKATSIKSEDNINNDNDNNQDENKINNNNTKSNHSNSNNSNNNINVDKSINNNKSNSIANSFETQKQEVSSILKSIITKMFEENPVYDINGFKQLLFKALNLNSNQIANKELMLLINSIIEGLSIVVEGNIYLRTIPNVDPIFNEYRNKILTEFSKKSSLTKTEVSEVINNNEYIKEVMKSVCASYKNNKWVLKKFS